MGIFRLLVAFLVLIPNQLFFMLQKCFLSKKYPYNSFFLLIFMNYITFKLYLVNRTKIELTDIFRHLFNQENVEPVQAGF